MNLCKNLPNRLLIPFLLSSLCFATENNHQMEMEYKGIMHQNSVQKGEIGISNLPNQIEQKRKMKPIKNGHLPTKDVRWKTISNKNTLHPHGEKNQHKTTTLEIPNVECLPTTSQEASDFLEEIHNDLWGLSSASFEGSHGSEESCDSVHSFIHETPKMDECASSSNSSFSKRKGCYYGSFDSSQSGDIHKIEEIKISSNRRTSKHVEALTKDQYIKCQNNAILRY